MHDGVAVAVAVVAVAVAVARVAVGHMREAFGDDEARTGTQTGSVTVAWARVHHPAWAARMQPPYPVELNPPGTEGLARPQGLAPPQGMVPPRAGRQVPPDESDGTS